jgi:UDP-GlcNAc:undecaprenyl-phosphate/decaprenyl-phosphate GlcNAc-1-phosphate transferase
VSAVPVVVALPVAALVIWALLRIPAARRVVSLPSGDRWAEHETPAFGGVGIFLGLWVGVLAAIGVGGVKASEELFGILGGCTIVFLAGLVDDVRSLPPLAKLAAQIGAAALVLSTGLSVQIVSNPALAAFVGVLWFVGITNAFNLLDNMDGLAGTLAVIAATFFAIDSVTIHHDRLLLVLSLGLALATIGFLPFNFRPRLPAAVFMGDSGAQLLGFGLAALALATSWKVAETTIATLILPLLVLAIPILDTALVAGARFLEGRPVYRGGRDHASHRLVRSGLTEKRTVVLLAAISAALGATALIYSGLGNQWLTLVGVLISFALLVQLAGFLADLEHDSRPESPDVPLRAILLKPRRLAEVLVDFALISAAFSVAYLLLVQGSGTANQKHVFLLSLPVILAARYACFIPLGLYSGVWRFAGAREAGSVVIGVTISEVIAVGVVWGTNGPFADFPLSTYVVDALLAIILVGASRFGERALFRALTTLKDRSGRRRVVIVGAGRAGRSLLRELRETAGEQVVGFVDDHPKLRRRRMQGVPILGTLTDAGRVLAEARPDLVLVTIPDAPRERLDAIVYECAEAGVPCRFVRRQLDLDPSLAMGVEPQATEGVPAE